MKGMKGSRVSLVVAGGVVVALGGALATSLSIHTTGGGETATAVDDPPASVEHVAGSDIARVTLSERAAERLDVQTAATTMHSSGRQRHLVIPYSSLLYDAEGGAWAYTSPERLAFVRQAVTVASVRGDRVILRDGPSPGTQVVTVGAAELWGTEFEVGH